MFVYLHTDTRTCMHTSTRLPSVLLSQIASGKTCVFSERTGGIELERRRAWDHRQRRSDRHHWRRTGRCGVLPVHHLSEVAPMVVCTQLWMSCRREPSESSFPSADRDIPTVHVHLHQTGVMNILHPTQVRPTCPWRCSLRCSMCLWAAAEMSSSMCPQ